ncbi:beta-galactosidase-1-like protein 3 isoform X5 [Papio anubis]|uniref:beta-galactosidase-1-like protein 3 isoform X5 n=1 Tax=Papio anubis TaxID=9555 RepID=UPI0004F1F3A3|nr:beta-galactosidase-1-like protein 3 isoform X5 [Papio anubis]
MKSPPLLSPRLSWRRMVGVFFLPFILPAFAPRFKQEESLMLGTAHPPQPRFNWSHLTPLELKNRSVGLGTASTGRGKPHFTLEGRRFLICGGSIHYFRVPRAYWRDRLLKLRACGFNTVTTYVPWNLHEPERGKFDFSGNLDLEAFVLMAAEIGLWVILRPGPYICSEMDLGGLPSWLLQDPRLLLRTTNKGFTEAVEKYFDHLIPRVIPLQYRQGGPVIAVQVENEYGSFNKDKTYMPYLHKALLRRGIVELLLTSDGEKNVLSGHTKGVLAAINLQKVQRNTFNQLHKVQRDKPLLVMEYWVGWFDRWGDKHHVKDAKEVERAVSEFIKYEISFNVYMFHGGTNFGFMNGATNFGKHTGIVTSYDYDAVLTEAGDYTEKYFKLQKLLESVSATPLPQVPKLTPKAVYPPMRPSLYLPLWDALSYLNEVFLDETMIGILNENNQDLHIPELRDCRYLRILVENQGRVNFSWQIQNEQKGITGSVSINNSSLEGFTIYSLEMKMSFFERLRSATWKPVPDSHQGPAFYRGTLKAGPSPKDTFLSLLNWNYGFVFINGRNLGRYWNIGPQQTLYLPAVWLRPEDNEVRRPVSALTSHKLSDQNPFFSSQVILFEKMLSGSDIKSTDKPML